MESRRFSSITEYNGFVWPEILLLLETDRMLKDAFAPFTVYKH